MIQQELRRRKQSFGGNTFKSVIQNPPKKYAKQHQGGEDDPSRLG